MIVVAILGFLISCIRVLIPDTWDMDLSTIESFNNVIGEIFNIACWLLPMDTVVAILLTTLSLIVFRITIALLKTVWAILPIL